MTEFAEDPHMFQRWAVRKRITGLIFLGTAAVALATAAFLFLVGLGPFALTPAVITLPLVGTAVVEFVGARKWERRD